jgi:transcriptional regulator of heat shock response
LGALEGQRLLFQPHTSAGRLPTQDGYRCVVDDILTRPDLLGVLGGGAAYPNRQVRAALRSPLGVKGKSAILELSRVAAHSMAAATNCLALVTVLLTGTITAAQLYYSGLAGLLSQPEFTQPCGPEHFMRLLQMLDNERSVLGLLDELSASGAAGQVAVYIGRENSCDGLDEVSVVTGRYRAGIVALIGPTRMPYREAITTVATAAHTLDELLKE